MESSNFVFSGIISIIFFILKIIDYKYFLKTDVDTKSLIRNTFYVFLASFLGLYSMQHITPQFSNNQTSAFINNPDF